MRYYFYKFARQVVRLFLAIFYSNTRITNKQYLDFKNPTIIVSNHPNTLLDPLNTASRIVQHSFFLANASLYKSAIGNWFFTTFYCVPIERPKDRGGRKISNADSFAKCDEHLSNGGTLYIAPQGYSQIKRRIDEIKTGTARIALSAENSSDWKLGLEILPFGLNYESPRFFRTDLLINTGDPILVSNYREAYERDPYQTAKALTHDLQVAMELLLPDTKDDEEDAFVKELEEIQQTELPLDMAAAFQRSKKMIQRLHGADSNFYNKIKTATESYRKELVNQKIDDDAVVKSLSINNIGFYLKNIGFFIFGFPFFLYGAVNHLLLAGIPAILPKIMKLYPGYDSNIKTISGMVLWPILYGVQGKLVHSLTGTWWITLLYLITLYPLGVFAWKYKEQIKEFLKINRAMRFLKTSKTFLLEKRTTLLQLLTELSQHPLPAKTSSEN